MDISEQYIKMCDCPKIQKKWIKENGDYYFGSYDPCSPDDPAYGGYVEKEVRVYSRLEAYFGDMLWLPRQDQIQAMVRKHKAQEMGSKRPHDEWFPKGDIGLGYVFNGFIKFASDYMREIYNSFEQLWLAFYIYEKHKKIWDGDKWIKNKRRGDQNAVSE